MLAIALTVAAPFGIRTWRNLSKEMENDNTFGSSGVAAEQEEISEVTLISAEGPTSIRIGRKRSSTRAFVVRWWVTREAVKCVSPGDPEAQPPRRQQRRRNQDLIGQVLVQRAGGLP